LILKKIDGYTAYRSNFSKGWFMKSELQKIITAKDVIVLTSLETAAIAWLLESYVSDPNIQTLENAHQLDTEKVLAFCRQGLSENKTIILTAQFRSQLPIINIASLCNEKRKALVNIDLSGWNATERKPSAYSSF
jgi:hypothetical protein